MRLVFDLEANGLLDDASLIHCLVVMDKDTKDVQKFEPSQVEQGIRLIMSADEVIGHNVIGYDLALITKLYPWFSIAEDKVTDTLILSRLMYADLSDRDRSRGAIDPKLFGSHSLKAWGQRLGFHKADYDGGWETFTQEMLEYNVRDVEVTDRLHSILIESKAYSQKASVLEHQVAHIVARQERYGFPFDEEAAVKLTSTLLKRKAELEMKLEDTFQPFYLPNGVTTPKKTMKRQGVQYLQDAPYTKLKLTVFNPGSRHHIANRLKTIHNWEPKEFTPDGSPKVDEAVLGTLPWTEAKLLTEYLKVQKILGMVAEGDNAWIKLAKAGRIHGEVNTCGAVSARATHRNPNLAQVPSVGSPYGRECRSLFTASKGRKLVGIDMSGIELRCLAHFMARYDGGVYGKEVVSGDIHTVNQHAAGLPTRNDSKRFIYAFLYGAGSEKIGSIIGKGKKDGAILKKRFLERTPALARLISAVQRAAERGYLVGMDGRHLHIRQPHAALNLCLQSSAALLSKQWIIELDKAIKRLHWCNKVQQVTWVHDECQFDCDPDIADEFGKLAVECISKAGEFFNFNIPLTGEYKVGNNWAETH